MKDMCKNPYIKPMQKENQTLRHRLWQLIKEFEIYCEKKHEKKMPFS
jgi:hypothetical protein